MRGREERKEDPAKGRASKSRSTVLRCLVFFAAAKAEYWLRNQLSWDSIRKAWEISRQDRNLGGERTASEGCLITANACAVLDPHRLNLRIPQLVRSNSSEVVHSIDPKHRGRKNDSENNSAAVSLGHCL